LLFKDYAVAFINYSLAGRDASAFLTRLLLVHEAALVAPEASLKIIRGSPNCCMTVCELILWVLTGHVADQTLPSDTSHPSSSNILLHRFKVLIARVLLDFFWDLEMLLSTVFIE